MVEYVLSALGAILILLGGIGCVVPILPGPILAYAALWMIPANVGAPRLWIAGIAVAVATFIDYFLPTVFARKFKCSRLGVTGCVIGTIIGIFFLPLGLIFGPILGAMAGELLSGTGLRGALRGGISAMLGFVACLLVKFAAVALCAYWFYVSQVI